MREGKRVSRDESYSCEEWCTDNGEAVHHRRAAYHCALPGFRETQWADDEDPPAYHMGRMRLRVVDDDYRGNPLRPVETHEDGCPGAWYRSPFVGSLVKYERFLTEGGFSENIALTRCTDRLVLDAINLMEQERLRCRGYEAQLRSDAMDG